VLQFLSEDGMTELKDYGSISKQSVSVLLRQMVQLEMAGAAQFFGEPEFDLNDLIQFERDGRGLISVLELSDVQDKPVLFSTFMLWMLATLYNHLPEVGDLDKPKLVFFFDEAHLLFKDASTALLDEVEKVVRLIRSKGVGIFFITQNPRDVPQTVLGQLGHKVQHALRAFTPDDEAALKSAARTFPKTDFYDVQETLTTLGIGEALVTVLTSKGVPTPPFATRIVPPATRMGPLTDAELAQRCSTPQVRKYAMTVDRESARELLAQRVVGTLAPAGQATPAGKAPAGAAPSAWDSFINSPVIQQAARQAARTATSAITRGLMQSLMKSLK
jgi:DNA helicase HerA-like ATPase